MKKVIFPLSFLLFILIATPKLYSQKYEKQVEAVTDEVWSWDMPVFNNYVVPEKYQQESAVVLAKHTRIDASGKKTNVAKEVLFGRISGKLLYERTDRYLIKINDQAALEKFSELSFRERQKWYRFGYSNKETNIIGARIIKPDGRILPVNVKDEAVSITEGRKEKESHKKIAIPGLQIGDILDYFEYNIQSLESYNMMGEELSFFTMTYPCLFYSVLCEFGKNLTIEYRPVNGSPDFTIAQNKNSVTLYAEETDLLRIADPEQVRWISPYRSLPMIRYSILQNGSKLLYKPVTARPLGIHKNVTPELILEDAKCYMAFRYPKAIVANPTFNSALKEYKSSHPDVTKNELAEAIYLLMKLYYPVSGYNPNGRFLQMMGYYFKKQNIDYSFIFTSGQYGPEMNELFVYTDVDYMVLANQGSQLFTSRSMLQAVNNLPGEYQGQNAVKFELAKYKKPSDNKAQMVGVSGEYQFPVSQPEENKTYTKLDVSFSEQDILQLICQRNVKLTGDSKHAVQQNILTFDECDREVRSFLDIQKTYLEEMMQTRSGRKEAEKLEAFYEEERKNQEEMIISEVTAYHHDISPTKLYEYAVISPGIVSTSPVMEYKMEYSLDGLVKNAGDNLILEVGKLIGQQWNPDESSRNRNIDAWIGAPFMLEYEVEIKIPEGYQAEDIGIFNYETGNKYIQFKSQASIKDGVIKIKAEKIYSANFISPSDWQQLLDVLDNAHEFTTQSIILKKIH